MPEMPDILKKEYGPFSGLEWGVIIVGGVGLGLALRFYLNRRGGDESAAPGATGTTSPDYGVDTGVAPFTSSGTQYNQGQIVQDVLEAIGAQKPPPASTDPTDVSPDPAPGDNTDDEGQIGIPKFPDGSDEMDRAVPGPDLSKPAPTVKTYPELRAAVRATGHQPGTVINEADVMAALRKIGRNPGSTLDPADIDVLKRWYAANH